MTLQEAIEINKDRRAILLLHIDEVGAEANQLGIEALKRVQHLRQFWGKDLNLKLPGETAE